MSRIFISYRRADAADVTGRMYDHLVQDFAKDDVFKDVDSIDAGVDFRQSISAAVEACDVILAVIGSDWVTAVDGDGENRLANPDDFVRIELETGLQRDIPIIPVLVRGATMPEKNDLPESLQPLAYRNAVLLRPDPDFATDIQRLKRALSAILEARSDQKPVVTRVPTLQSHPGIRKRIVVLALAAFILSLIIFLLYSVDWRSSTEAQSIEPDICSQPNPPAECLFKQ
jgi:hypothetical protein